VTVLPVVVVGGGVMGSAAAWALAGRGAPVTLLEQYHFGHDRGASHGTSRIFRLAYPDRFYVELAATALPLWRRLEADTGVRVLSRTGAVDHGPREVIAALYDAIRSAGHDASLMGPTTAAARWPAMRFDDAVMTHPNGGRIHADAAVAAFQKAAARLGVRLHETSPVRQIDAADGRAVVVTEAGAEIEARAVVVAAGGWTARLVGSAVTLPPLRVTQEQPAHFPVAGALGWPSFIHHPGAGLEPGSPLRYGLGSLDGLKVGAHVAGLEIDLAHRDRTIDQERVRTLVDYVQRWLPGVDPSRPSPQTCTYTLTPTEDFVVDRVGALTVLAGFSGHGFKFAPAIGALAADLVLDEAPAPERFALGRS
jgi:sarcosine oxidase